MYICRARTDLDCGDEQVYSMADYNGLIQLLQPYLGKVSQLGRHNVHALALALLHSISCLKANAVWNRSGRRKHQVSYTIRQCSDKPYYISASCEA